MLFFFSPDCPRSETPRHLDQNYPRMRQMGKASADIRSLARAHTETAILTLARIMASPQCPPSARVAAATALLERGWGKADQNINVKGTLEHKLIALVQGLDEKPVNGKVVDHEETKPVQQLSGPDYA